MNVKVSKKGVCLGLVMATILIISAIPITMSGSSGHPDLNGLIKGDILFMDLKSNVGEKKSHFPGYSNDHCAIYMGPDFQNGMKFFEVDYDDAHGRDYSGDDSFCSYYEHFTFYRVVGATNDEKDNATDWCQSREGKGYQHTARKNNDPNESDEWYCSELLWAGYYNCNGVGNQGVDIDYNGWSIVWPWFVPAVQMGCPFIYLRNDITRDSDVDFLKYGSQ